MTEKQVTAGLDRNSVETVRRGRVRSGTVLVVVLVILVSAVSLRGVESIEPQTGGDDIVARPQRQDIEQFMARKLKAAQLTLEGVMTNRFQQIQDNASEMVALSRDAAWKQMASPSYIQDTADFVSAAEYLNRVAAAEDAEGTIMAFNRVTACCANCHQHVRTPRVASLQRSTDATNAADLLALVRPHD
jgi:cytochrome c556